MHARQSPAQLERALALQVWHLREAAGSQEACAITGMGGTGWGVLVSLPSADPLGAMPRVLVPSGRQAAPHAKSEQEVALPSLQCLPLPALGGHDWLLPVAVSPPQAADG